MPCDGAHFEYKIIKIPAVALRFDKHAVKKRWCRRDGTFRSPTAPLDLRWRIQVTHKYSWLHLHRDLSESFVMSLRLYCALTVLPQRLNALFGWCFIYFLRCVHITIPKNQCVVKRTRLTYRFIEKKCWQHSTCIMLSSSLHVCQKWLM